MAWHGDNNGTDESLTGCYSSGDDPRREDKAGLHVNCDDLLGGYDCRSRCLAGGRRKQETFYPSIGYRQVSAAVCHDCSVLLCASTPVHHCHHTHEKQDKTKKINFLRARNSQNPEKQQKADLQLFNRMRRLQEKLQSLLHCSTTRTRYSSMQVRTSGDRSKMHAQLLSRR